MGPECPAAVPSPSSAQVGVLAGREVLGGRGGLGHCPPCPWGPGQRRECSRGHGGPRKRTRTRGRCWRSSQWAVNALRTQLIEALGDEAEVGADPCGCAPSPPPATLRASNQSFANALICFSVNSHNVRLMEVRAGPGRFGVALNIS